MSLLQLTSDELLRHNVWLDVLGSDEPWPLPVARVADLLPASDAQSVDPDSESWTEDFAEVLCACTRQVRKDRRLARFQWESVFAMVMEEALPDVISYFNCEYIKPRPDDAYETYRDRLNLASSHRGTASLLALLPVDCPAIDDSTAPNPEDEACPSPEDEHMASSHKGYARGQDYLKDFSEALYAIAIADNTSEAEDASDAHRSLDLGWSDSETGSDATLYEVEDDVASGSELSIEVEIEDHEEDPFREIRDPPSRRRDATSVPIEQCSGRKCASSTSIEGDGATSIATEYSSALRCDSTASSCSTSASSPSQMSPASSLAPSHMSKSRNFLNPGPLYDKLPAHILQQHIFPSPFHPIPLAPLLCVADEQNIVSLMCSALYQRRALSLDVPVVGVLLPQSSPAQCELLFGWIEREASAGHSLPRTHIVARDFVVDLQSPPALSRLFRFLARLGPYVAPRLVERIGHQSSPARSLVWRADSRLEGEGSRGSALDERIRLWAHEVRRCNQSDEDDEDAFCAPAGLQKGKVGVDDLRQLVKLLRVSASRDRHRRRSFARASRCSKDTSGSSMGTASTTQGSASILSREMEPSDLQTSTMDSDVSACVSGSGVSTTFWQRVYSSLGAWYARGERSTRTSASSSTYVDSSSMVFA